MSVEISCNKIVFILKGKLMVKFGQQNIPLNNENIAILLDKSKDSPALPTITVIINALLALKPLRESDSSLAVIGTLMTYFKDNLDKLFYTRIYTHYKNYRGNYDKILLFSIYRDYILYNFTSADNLKYYRNKIRFDKWFYESIYPIYNKIISCDDRMPMTRTYIDTLIFMKMYTSTKSEIELRGEFSTLHYYYTTKEHIIEYSSLDLPYDGPSLIKDDPIENVIDYGNTRLCDCWQTYKENEAIFKEVISEVNTPDALRIIFCMINGEIPIHRRSTFPKSAANI